MYLHRYTHIPDTCAPHPPPLGHIGLNRQRTQQQNTHLFVGSGNILLIVEDFGDVFETVIILPWHVFIAMKADATDVKLRRLVY